MLAILRKLYEQAAVCLSPCPLRLAHGNNSAGNIVGNHNAVLKIFCVLKKVLGGFNTVLDTPIAVTLNMRNALFIEINASVLIADADIIVGKTKMFLGKFVFPLIRSADYKFHKITPYLKKHHGDYTAKLRHGGTESGYIAGKAVKLLKCVCGKRNISEHGGRNRLYAGNSEGKPADCKACG